MGKLARVICGCALGTEAFSAVTTESLRDLLLLPSLSATDDGRAKRVFETALERVRHSYGLRVYAYVVMPEHVHLLLSEPERQSLADALKSLKQGVSRRLIGEAHHFWRKRYYDFNVHNYHHFVEKVKYIHRNPVKRGLCERPEDWEWE